MHIHIFRCLQHIQTRIRYIITCLFAYNRLHVYSGYNQLTL